VNVARDDAQNVAQTVSQTVSQTVAQTVAQTVGRTLVESGVRQVFGVVGSGNFSVSNAMVAAGARFVSTRHEAGATVMADAYARLSGEVAAVTVHQGCGFTNTLTGLTEAAKSRTPLVVVAADVTEERSNFYVDQEAIARAVGAVPITVDDPARAYAAAVTAVRTARADRRTVVLNLPISVQAEEVPEDRVVPGDDGPTFSVADGAVERLAALLEAAEAPVFVAGRGARGARRELEQLAEQTGALLATSAVAKGLFAGSAWSLDVSGGFASPLAAELIEASDLVVGWGCALNMWTTRQRALVGPGATVVQVDLDPTAPGRHLPVDLGVHGDVAEVANRVSALVTDRPGRRTDEVRDRIAAEIRWRDVAYEDLSTDDEIDPRTATVLLDDLLPSERVVSVDSGNFMGYPSMFLSVPDERGFCFTQAYQSIGLGLATAVGAALAQPHRLPVAALGDGGALMGTSELETVVRLGIPLVVVVYNDAAYGAEVHHFGPGGDDLSLVRFPPTDLAAIARGYGFDAATVRRPADLDAVATWLAGDRSRPLLVDLKVVGSEPSWWLEEAFRGH
jgi:thiamine pyrophosphate-dependent acetolactate synthase large subunit-like protein